MARANEPHGNDRTPPHDPPVVGNPGHSEDLEEATPTRAAEPSRGVESSRRSRVEDRGSHATHTQTREGDHSGKDSFIGIDHAHRATNASWGAIFAGTVTFLALVLVFGLISTAMGLTEVDGVAIGIWSIIAILLALAAAGYVAGALAVRAGLLHGLVTWATSLVGVVLLIGWLGTSVLGAVGGALGGVAETAGGPEVVQEEIEGAEEDIEEATQDAQDTAAEAQDDVAAGTWWGVAGLLVGAVVAALTGAAGAKSAHTRRDQEDTGTHRV